MLAPLSRSFLPRHLKQVTSAISRSRSFTLTPVVLVQHRGIHVTYPDRQSTLEVEREPTMKFHDYVADSEDIQKANQQYKGIVEIKDTTYGKGVFALREFQKGDLVVSGTALYSTDQKTSHTVQTGWNSHVQMNSPATLINHSCSANVGPKDNDNGCYDWYAMKDISKGEELFSDYESFEYEIEGFDCSCGTPACRGTLGGFRVHGDQVLQQYGDEYIASYLKEDK